MHDSDSSERTAHRHDDDICTNESNNPTLESMVNARLSRREMLVGGLGAAAAFTAGSAGLLASADAKALPAGFSLSFNPVAKSLADVVSVPAGYSVTVLTPTGEALTPSTPANVGDGSETGDSYAFRSGDHHDGMYYFGLSADGSRPDPRNSRRGLLCVNHENITQPFLHPNGATVVGGVRTVADEVVKEMNAHGVSITELVPGPSRATPVAFNRNSRFNRRITSLTDMVISGPVAGDAQLVTRYSPNGTRTRGTVNNCANGFTPWGTYLTCEENWAFYFRRSATDNASRSAAEVVALNRYGLTQGAAGNYGWTTVAPQDPNDTRFSRWDATVSGATAADDFRNAPNTFGWIVEIDPYDPQSTPRKRTAMARFFHEGAWPANFVPGRPLVYYMGCDSRGEYIYKYVSEALLDPRDFARGDRLAVGDKYLDRGTLYVARFDATGTGSWIPLLFGSNGLDPNNAIYPFRSQADVLLHARLAADSVGATKMDRPEWGAVNRTNGEVYFTLTNNSQRGVGTGPAVDAANPRSYADQKGAVTQRGNVNGHIIRFREAGNNSSATSFRWDIFGFGAEAGSDPATVNLSGLTDVNDFSSPDGLWFGRDTNDSNGLLWIQTDDGAYTDVTNCMLLAAVPGKVGDGGAVTINGQQTFVGAKASESRLRRFLVGPKGCELTGLDTTPDGRVLFVNIQHPGENTPAAQIGNPEAYESHFPDGGLSRPRSATLAIVKDDFGIVGL
ncbi:MAG: PhoX family phosphatase [Gammaproteobacteria bacterium]|nr:PhoX family phosphatase [Gammaproteobacteria bacterium]